MSFQFSGHPKYLAEAAQRLGFPVTVADRARRQPAVGECANLLSQAIDAKFYHRPEILGHARERVEALRVAYEAAQAMLDEVTSVIDPPPIVIQGTTYIPDPDQDPESKPGRRRKAE